MTRPDLVIFDCDGVLVDSEKVSNHAMATNLARHGLTLTVEESMAASLASALRAAGVVLETCLSWNDAPLASLHLDLGRQGHGSRA